MSKCHAGDRSYTAVNSDDGTKLDKFDMYKCWQIRDLAGLFIYREWCNA